MNNIIKKETHKITIGRTTQQLLQDLRNRGHEISKGYLLQLTNDLELKDRGLVSVISQMTKKGMRPHNIYSKEGAHEIVMSVDKIMPEEKQEYLIESTKPKQPMTMIEVRQFGLALAGISEAYEVQQKQIEYLEEQYQMCRVSAIKDNELRDFARRIIEYRLNKNKEVYEDKSARQKQYAYLFSYLRKEFGISRITNLNTKEHQIVRDKLIEIMEWEGIPY